MIIDTSAILAILLAENDARLFADAIAAAPHGRLSVASYVEAGIRLTRLENAALTLRELDTLIKEAGIEIVPVMPEHGSIALAAYRDFGKGSKNPAQLNYGDCLTYALAKTSGEPLLFKGNDFGHTDIKSALD